ncbi:MAG: potassium-transporting ATPase subunit KdpA [Candidatus Binatus sp.]|jgi:potassium-transporting ATPase potassium-binding subunit|uniref:potassium-transporting ATPase subunit KdpA n=1 Tax=Candidatus Binatus sp. TaxID=2811406 RepID=UPI003CB0E311
MNSNAIIQIALFSLIIIAISVPLGLYMAKVFAGERTFLDPAFVPVERLIYRLCGVDPATEQTWVEYATSLLLFSLVGMVVLYALQRLQGLLPLNPQGLGAISTDSSFNTAASFITNTNWQSYTPETTMSYLTQMAGLAFHNFVSAAAGLALAIAVIRGFVRREGKTLGNFWYDLTRATLWVLVPICVVFTLILIWQGVPQNFSAYTQVKTLEHATQTIAQGPVASQIAIKQLGTNGGGFYNANSAHPYENPTGLTDLLELIAIFALGAGLTHTFGQMAGDRRQGWALFAAMGLLFLMGVMVANWSEQRGNPQFAKLGIDQSATATQSGGNMEGKEVRFGIVDSAIWATATTDASNGSVNSMHDSFTPLGGLVPLLNLHLGEVVFGGVGTGLAGMIVMAVLTVFIAGLMVGRTPEYLGKKIQSREMKLAMLYILIFPAVILLPTAVAATSKLGLAGIANPGPHGFSEILYAYSSSAANNGSAFAGLSANTPFYNWTLGFVMLFGRFMMMIPVLAIAGSLVHKKAVPESAGTFPTNGSVFVVLLIAVVLIVGALTFFASWALGPVVEHLAMMAGHLY